MYRPPVKRSERVRESVNNTLWGGKEGKVRARRLFCAAAAALALAAPGLAKAGAVPPELLAQAQANPDEQFNVIVQTPGGDGSAPTAHAGPAEDGRRPGEEGQRRRRGSLSGEEIPLGARIIHVADALDSMLTARIYRHALTEEEALGELRAGEGTQFCPRCVRALEQALGVTRETPAELAAVS
jgi:HD domain